jgi:hypothetical protein
MRNVWKVLLEVRMTMMMMMTRMIMAGFDVKRTENTVRGERDDDDEDDDLCGSSNRHNDAVTMSVVAFPLGPVKGRKSNENENFVEA